VAQWARHRRAPRDVAAPHRLTQFDQAATEARADIVLTSRTRARHTCGGALLLVRRTGAPEPMSTNSTAPQRAPAVVFRQLLVNTLVISVTSSFLWFALTFWVYLETRSVVATGVIGGAFSLSSAIVGPAFGTYVDHHRKHAAMTMATMVAAVCFAIATALFVAIDTNDLLRLGAPWFWLLVGITLLGSVAGQMRSIALSTCVTLLVPEESRDRANGLVGTVTGVSYAITSVFSGLVIGQLGMGWALSGSLALTVVALIHLRTIYLDEPEPEHATDGKKWNIDVRAAVEAIRAVPGLPMVIVLAAVNNILAGVFIALIDPYGLSLVSVETWGFLWGFISLAFIVGGLIVVKFGLGRSPLRIIILGNIANWVVCGTFALRSSIVLLVIGMVIWLTLIPIIEAAEQTVLQRSIPYERQGRVFGFAQLVENAAAPLTAFLIGPLAEVTFMPFMTDGRGADAIGSWFGTGPERGLALLFTIAGLIGIVATLVARASRSYRMLSAQWAAEST
jgi:DHA3 family multidrug efflux protein-like MFS transporter